jgi:hypothetical protein
MVVGSPRSGTTLVQRLACEISGVRMPPETHFFTEFVPGLLARRTFPLDAAALSEEIGNYLALEGSRDLALVPQAVIDDLGGACERPFALFDALVRQLAGPAEVWGEKTPDHLVWWRALARAAPWLRFVAVVRDPRAVVASTLSMPWDDPRVPAWGDRTYLSHAARWAVLQDQVGAMHDTLGAERCLVLRYEDVVVDPGAARTALASFLGRPGVTELQVPSEGMVLPWEPWKRHAFDPVGTDRVSAWRATLGERRSRHVGAVCRAGMGRFGYVQGRPGPLRAAWAWAGLGPMTLGRVARYRRAYAGYMEAIDRCRL